MASLKNYKVAVADTETDPFKFGRVPKPFCLEFYSDEVCEVFWGPNCIRDFMLWLEIQPEQYVIYFHNGGKFDFYFMLEHLDNPVKIINGRIVEAKLYNHKVRDSIAIIPIALKQYQKTEIDYKIMELGEREKPKNKKEILAYLHDDCRYLFDLVSAFVDRFGFMLTVGKTAMTEIQKRHNFKIMGKNQDPVYREYYFGGRVQCFDHGLLKGPWKMADINSSYPNSMRNFKHPVNGQFDIGDKLPDNFDVPYFAHIRARSDGALPVKLFSDTGVETGLKFPTGTYDFKVCSHEIEVALKYGLIDILDVYEVHTACETIVFDTYVDDFFSEKDTAKTAGDMVAYLFAKFMLNSGYGKFGQNPDNFQNWKLVREYGDDLILEQKGFELHHEFGEFELWSKPALITDSAYYDVSIAASITSASRAVLLEGIQHAEQPIYCDTDSLLCRDFHGDIDKHRLGAWDIEYSDIPMAAIGGKKLYALYDPKDARKKVPAIKTVSKGGNLSLKQIIKACNGDTVLNENMAPTFSLSKNPHFISRNFKMTIDD